MAIALPADNTTALTAAAFTGDEEALGGLLARHQRAAYNLAYHLLGREADADDAVQEAFLLAVRAIRGDGAPPRELDRFKPWLMRVVANAALGQLRRRPSFRPVSVDEVADVLPGGLGEPEREAERRETRGDVLRALLALPDAQRAALTLREHQGLSYVEIASMLGVSHAAVETLLFRARRGFRDAYAGLTAASRLIGCPHLAPLLSAMIDGELDASAWAEPSAHADRCPRCRGELRALRRGRRLLALIPWLAVPTAWHGTATASAAGAAAVAGIAAAAPAAPAPLATSGGLVAKLASLAGAKATGAAVAAGLGTAVVVTPMLEPGPDDLARAISAAAVAGPSIRIDGQAALDGAPPADRLPPEPPAVVSRARPGYQRLTADRVDSDAADHAGGHGCQVPAAGCGPAASADGPVVAALAASAAPAPAAIAAADAPERASGHARQPPRPAVAALVAADASERGRGARRGRAATDDSGAVEMTGKQQAAPADDEPEPHTLKAEHQAPRVPDGAAITREVPRPLANQAQSESPRKAPHAVPPAPAAAAPSRPRPLAADPAVAQRPGVTPSRAAAPGDKNQTGPSRAHADTGSPRAASREKAPGPDPKS